MMGAADVLPPKRQAVVERLRKRIEGYRRQQNETLPRYDNAMGGIYEQDREQTMLLQQRFVEAKAKKNKKSERNSNQSRQPMINMQSSQQPQCQQQSISNMESQNVLQDLQNGISGVKRSASDAMSSPADHQPSELDERLTPKLHTSDGGPLIKMSRSSTPDRACSVESQKPRSSSFDDLLRGGGNVDVSHIKQERPQSNTSCSNGPVSTMTSGQSNAMNSSNNEAFPADSLQNLSLPDESIHPDLLRDLIADVMANNPTDLMNEFDYDSSEKVNTASFMAVNFPNTVISSSTNPNFPTFSTLDGSTPSPAALTLKQMAEQRNKQESIPFQPSPVPQMMNDVNKMSGYFPPGSAPPTNNATPPFMVFKSEGSQLQQRLTAPVMEGSNAPGGVYAARQRSTPPGYAQPPNAMGQFEPPMHLPNNRPQRMPLNSSVNPQQPPVANGRKNRRQNARSQKNAAANAKNTCSPLNISSNPSYEEALAFSSGTTTMPGPGPQNPMSFAGSGNGPNGPAHFVPQSANPQMAYRGVFPGHRPPPPEYRTRMQQQPPTNALHGNRFPPPLASPSPPLSANQQPSSQFAPPIPSLASPSPPLSANQQPVSQFAPPPNVSHSSASPSLGGNQPPPPVPRYSSPSQSTMSNSHQSQFTPPITNMSSPSPPLGVQQGNQQQSMRFSTSSPNGTPGQQTGNNYSTYSSVPFTFTTPGRGTGQQWIRLGPTNTPGHPAGSAGPPQQQAQQQMVPNQFNQSMAMQMPQQQAQRFPGSQQINPYAQQQQQQQQQQQSQYGGMRPMLPHQHHQQRLQAQQQQLQQQQSTPQTAAAAAAAHRQQQQQMLMSMQSAQHQQGTSGDRFSLDFASLDFLDSIETTSADLLSFDPGSSASFSMLDDVLSGHSIP